MRIKEKIEKSGFFWLPATPEKKISGLLLISDGGSIDLEVVGLFDESIEGLNSALTGRADLGRIVGHVEKYGLVTLDDCFYRSSNIAFGGVSKSVVCVNKAYLGVAYNECEIVLFDEFKFSVEGIDEWVGISGLKVENDFKAHSAMITYQPPKELSINLSNNMRLLITFCWTPPGLPVTKEAIITQKIYFKLASDHDRPLIEYISTAYKITTLMCFATDRTVCIERVSATSKAIVRDVEGGKQIPVSVDLYYQSLPYDKREQKIDQHHMLFRYGQIKEDAERVINKWIAAYETIAPALNLYFSVRTGTHKYLESKFLALAQGLETLHRRTSDETMMDKTEFKNLTDAIVSHCPEEHKKWLSERLVYANEINLSRRLKFIVASFGKHIGSSEDRSKLVRSIVNTRNYLTHYDESNRDSAVSGVELLPLCLKMEAVFQLHLLKILGFTSEEIDSVCDNNSDIQRKLRKT